MSIDIKKVAQLLGGKVVAKIPDTDFGVLGAAQFVKIRDTILSSTHKKKVETIDVAECANINAIIERTTFTNEDVQLRANCWIRDEQGKTQIVVLHHGFIMALIEAAKILSQDKELKPIEKLTLPPKIEVE